MFNNIEEAIKAFFKDKLTSNGQFSSEELRYFVTSQTDSSAPGSPDRLLRRMRQQGKLNYQVINHRKGLYVALATPEKEAVAAVPTVGA